MKMAEELKDIETDWKTGPHRCRLVLFPLPLQGHMTPMLQLAHILYNKGFSITIIHTNFNSPTLANYPHFSFHSIPAGLSESEASTVDVLSLLSLLNTHCVNPFQECLQRLLSEASDDPVLCLISDALFHFTQAVADGLKIPRVVLRTGGASSFLVFLGFPLLREKSYLPVQGSQLEKPVAEFPPLRVKDLPVIETKEPEKFYQLVEDMVETTKNSSGLIFNTFKDLEQSALSSLHQQLSIPIFPIGPFHKSCPASSSSLITQDESCISWLDKQSPQSVIYVSFGSLAGTSKAEFLEIAWGLANSQKPFLWVVRPGSVRGANWLEPLPSGFLEKLEGRGHVVKWAPQQAVLAHPSVGAFWTHNGWNSTLESVCQGIPMICMPCFTDQRVNARYTSDVWKIGLHTNSGIERGKIVDTITRLFGKEGKEMRNRTAKLKEQASACLTQGGSSYTSTEALVHHILSFANEAQYYAS